MGFGVYINENLNESSLRREFGKILGGYNFISRVIIDYIKRKNFICEISREDFAILHLVGVTVVDSVNKVRCIDKDKCFMGDTFEEAKKLAYSYIESLN